MPQPAPFDPVALAADLVRIPSCDPPGGEIAVARRVASTLAALGLTAELDEFQRGRANVLARVRGRGVKPALVFSAHLDTVPTGDLPWRFDPFAGDVVDGRLRGRGASDMKSAVAAFVAAADRLNRRDQPLAGDVILAFTAGESSNCLGARHLVAQGFQTEIGAFLCGEPSTLDLIVVEKAILWLEAEAQGALGHVSGAAGVNAIEVMADFIRALRGLKLDLPAHPLLSPPSVHVGRIAGGTAVNVTPDRCRAEIDVRFGPGIGPETVLSQIETVLPPGVRLRINDFTPAVAESPDSPFVRLCAMAVRARTDRTPAVRGVSYYSDGAILLDGLDVPFAILGPGDLGMSCQYDETASVEAIRAAADIYVAIAEHWLA
jgi:succinyl-diaminopimelate desuccinylase